MHPFVTDRTFEQVQPHRAPDVAVIAKIRKECGIELQTMPGFGSEGSSHVQFRLPDGATASPVRIDRSLLRWLLPNLGCNVAAVVKSGDVTLIAFGRTKGNGADFGGAHFNSGTRLLSIKIALAQVGNTYLCEGESRIIYPAIRLATPSIIRPPC